MTVMEESEMASLNDDVVAEIIVKLPLKSAARSKCVSKKWRVAISGDPLLRRRLPLHMSAVYFPDDPARGGDGRPRVACAAAAGDCLLEDVGDLGSFFPFWEGAVVCDARNGLLLCRSPGTLRFYVANPVTRRWAALPAPAKDAQLSMLAFDPFSSPDHYHVVNFTGWRERGAAVEVFSSEARAWSAHDPEFGVPVTALSAGSVHFHDGAVYILAFSDPGCLVRMDVAGGECACTVVELPDEPVDGDGRVAHSGDRLHYVAIDGRGLLKVWTLEDSSPTRQWQLKHAAKLDDVNKGGSNKVRLLGMHPEKDVVYMWSPWSIVEYDMAGRISRAWELGKAEKGEKNRVVKTWHVPSSWYLSDCLVSRE
ncbi:hypothetical protein ACP70R_021201 [Stipagrostis hirtigluma subsp. patula]